MSGNNKDHYINIKKRVKNFRLFHQQKNPRPLLGFYVESEYPLFRYKAAKNLPTHRPLNPDDFKIEDYLDDCERLFEQHEACGGDFIWSGSAFWGIPWLEAALGCDIYADHSSGSITSRPLTKFSNPRSLPKFDKNNPWIIKTEEFLRGLKRRSKGRWPIGTTRMRGISDLLSAIYGGKKFIYMMLEKPEQVLSVCEKLTKFWIKYGKFQIDNIPNFQGGMGSFYYNVWVPHGTIWHQEDAVALLSPELYNKFIRSFDELIASSFSGCIIHQHPTGYMPIEEYIKMGMDVIELHIDEGGPTAKDLFETHKKILKNVPLLIWGDLSREDLDWIFSRLPAEGLAINTVVSGPEEAHELWERYIQ